MSTSVTAVFSRLSTDSAVKSLVADRIYPDQKPEDQPKAPYIVNEEGANEIGYKHGGVTGLEKERRTIRIVGRTYDEMLAVADAVQAAMNGQTWTAAGIWVQGAFLEDESESDASNDAGPDSLMQIREQDWLFCFSRI